MKKLLFILLAVFFVSCGGSIKSSWTNFRAHYNTHYNASNSFREGLKQEESQPVNVDPNVPIRVHEAPGQAGKEDFEKAIAKEAQLLRKFPDSKWTDDALFLIGRSYYYLNEFYPALQKFEELDDVVRDPVLKQNVIIWKGRTLLDLNQYGEAISYLEGALASDNMEWNPELRAEVKVLLAEHYAQLGNVQSASDNLSQALTRLGSGPFKGRTLFLYGEVLELNKQYQAAFSAYDKVASNFPDYEYIYWAGIKKANVAREQDRLDLALSIYHSMKKDDKNFQRRNDIDYEVARTLELKGNYSIAKQIYNDILHPGMNTLSRDAHAKIYFRLGKIYSDAYHNYKIAASYFDSSLTQATNIREFDKQYDVKGLATTFDRYTSVKQEVNRLDSLLYLSSLSPLELDSALNVIRSQKRRRLNQELSEGPSEKLMNKAGPDQDRSGENQRSSVYGFLNYKNAVLVADAKVRFEAFWGDRPLADNWRRTEVIQRIATDGDSVDNGISGTDPKVSMTDSEDSRLNMDLSEIPVTATQQQQMREQLNKKMYELGNMFFLTMNLPDSAMIYFQKVIDNHPQGELAPKSMYSLFELNKLNHNGERAYYWAKKIQDEYPDTKYAMRVSSHLRNESVTEDQPDSTARLFDAFQDINNTADSLSGPLKAEHYRNLALANRSSKLAPYIYYRAILEYIRFARMATDSVRYNTYWTGKFGRGDSSLQMQESLDSTSTANITTPPDSTGSKAGVRQRRSEFREPGTGGNPFYGAYWDSVRILLVEYDSVFTDAPHKTQIEKIEHILGQPAVQEHIRTCKELELIPQVKPDMDTFLSKVRLPEALKKTRLSGEIVFRFVLNSDGSILSYKQISEKTPLGIDVAYRAAIDSLLQFYPLSEEKRPFEAQCEVSFPIRN